MPQDISDFILKIENLSVSYNKRVILKDINLKISKGDFIGIIGPNGAGKTTLLKSILKLVHPSSGRIIFKGINLASLTPKIISQHIALILQSHKLIEDMRVIDVVRMGRYPFYKYFQFTETKKDKNVIEKTLNLTGISHLRFSKINHLSGGEQQLTFITRALVQEPEILILDEPLNHLDIKHKIKIMELLTYLNKDRNMTILVVLHDINIASEYCKKIILLNNGKIVKEGTPSEVIKEELIQQVYGTHKIKVAKNPFTQKLYLYIKNEI